MLKILKVTTALALLAIADAAVAQTPATPAPAAPPAGPPQFPAMTFFVTSKPGPDGANFGGLEGADRHCKLLATNAGAGDKNWRAYLSTQAVGGATAVNAKDRIGKGPWVNARGVQIAASVEDLHSANNKITAETIVA